MLIATRRLEFTECGADLSLLSVENTASAVVIHVLSVLLIAEYSALFSLTTL